MRNNENASVERDKDIERIWERQKTQARREENSKIFLDKKWKVNAHVQK